LRSRNRVLRSGGGGGGGGGGRRRSRKSLELRNPRFVFGALRTVTDAQIPPFVLKERDCKNPNPNPNCNKIEEKKKVLGLKGLP